MNLSQLYYFKKLAEVRHYSRAAKELFISQPTLSSAISSLEKDLGVSLFVREGRSIQLSEYGSVFYEYVRAALRELDDGLAALRSHQLTLHGTINLGAIFTVQDDYLPQLLKGFCQNVGNSVLIKTYQNFTNALTKQLHEGTIDVAFCGRRENESDISYHPLTYYDLKFCVQKDHPLADREKVSLDDIRKFTVYSYGRGTPIGEQVASLLKEYRMQNIIQIYQEDVAMGSFVSYNEDSNVGALMLDSVGMKLFPNLVAITVDEVPPQFYCVYLAYHTKRSRSKAAEQFIEFTKTYTQRAYDKLDTSENDELYDVC